jgi:phosphoribosylamine--glycine ligase
MLRMKSDLVELCGAAIDGKLDQCRSDWDERASVGIVLAAGGYPGSYNKGDVISGLPESEIEGEKVFHAGTRLNGEQVATNGGRVLCATALGSTVTEAQKRAYEVAARISWDGAFYRKDIAYRAIARENT